MEQRRRSASRRPAKNSIGSARGERCCSLETVAIKGLPGRRWCKTYLTKLDVLARKISSADQKNFAWAARDRGGDRRRRRGGPAGRAAGALQGRRRHDFMCPVRASAVYRAVKREDRAPSISSRPARPGSRRRISIEVPGRSSWVMPRWIMIRVARRDDQDGLALGSPRPDRRPGRCGKRRLLGSCGSPALAEEVGGDIRGLAGGRGRAAVFDPAGRQDRGAIQTPSCRRRPSGPSHGRSWRQ